MTHTEHEREIEMQVFRLERPEMFAYRIVAYLSRFGPQGCWPVELVNLAKLAQRKVSR